MTEVIRAWTVGAMMMHLTRHFLNCRVVPCRRGDS
jgi:hypothetical protein